MRILHWHVHGSWTTAFVEGPHEYLLPVDAERGPDGRGRARTWDWPEHAREVPVERLRETDFDVVVLQRPEELALVEEWTGRRPGRDVPAVFVEHNAPHGAPGVPDSRHPLAERSDILLVHVTAFNELFWDNGRAPTCVVEHGVPDPGHRWTGEIARAATAINEPVRRGRTVGTDLLPPIAATSGLDVFGMQVDKLPRWPGLRVFEDLPQHRMHAELARRRVFVHPARWTSLGLSLIEAMMLGMPVVVLGAAEAAVSVPPEAGVVTTSRRTLVAATRDLVDDPELAAALGDAARGHALGRWGVKCFLADWEDVLARVTA